MALLLGGPQYSPRQRDELPGVGQLAATFGDRFPAAETY
jgi:hypothetical protein